MVETMLDTFWCDKCGRITCEKHRSQHTCERQDFLAAKRRAMTVEQVAAEVAEKEHRRQQAEAEAEALKAAANRAISEGFLERKARRKLIASKSTHVANFLQRASIEAAPGRGKQELLELYTKASRANLALWNEVETPTVPGLLDHVWAEVAAAYGRGSEVTGLQVRLEDGPLDLRNPWDPPPPQPGA
jgi:cell division protein FtsB